MINHMKRTPRANEASFFNPIILCRIGDPWLMDAAGNNPLT